MLSSSKPCCILIQTPPSLDLEAAELALALAAFDEPVEVILQGAGVFWLATQEPRKPTGKSADKLLAAFPLYDITVLVSEQDAKALAHQGALLPQGIQVLTHDALSQRIQHAKQCFCF